jgi:hypothetical protein
MTAGRILISLSIQREVLIYFLPLITSAHIIRVAIFNRRNYCLRILYYFSFTIAENVSKLVAKETGFSPNWLID